MMLQIHPLFSVVNHSVDIVPMVLKQLESTNLWILKILLFISFLCLAFAKRLEPSIYKYLFYSTINLGGISNQHRFEVKMNRSAFALIGLSSFLSFWVGSTLFIQHVSSSNELLVHLPFISMSQHAFILFALLGSLYVVIHLFFGLFISAVITGEQSKLVEFISISWTTFLVVAPVFFTLSLVWALNPNLGDWISQVFMYVLLGFLALRFLKLLITSLASGIARYYLFLYLCTLEILPLVIIYQLVD